MVEQIVIASPAVMSNMPEGTRSTEWTSVSWFNKISDIVASRTSRCFGHIVATVVSVGAFIPSLAADLGYAVKGLYERKMGKSQPPAQNHMQSNSYQTLISSRALATNFPMPENTQHSLVYSAQDMALGNNDIEQAGLDGSENSLAFLGLPDEINPYVFEHLSLQDLSSLSQTCKAAQRCILSDDTMAKSWFAQIPASLQSQLTNIVTQKSDDQLRSWLEHFTNNQSIVDDLISRRLSCHFTKIILFNIYKLMCQSSTVNVIKKTNHSGCSGRITHLSAEGNRMATLGLWEAQIWRASPNGQWKKEHAVRHISPSGEYKFVINNICLSADGNLMATASDDFTAKILSRVDGQWIEEHTVDHMGCVNSVACSANGSHVATGGNDKLTKVLCRSTDGGWIEKCSVGHDDCVRKATFSADGRYIASVGGNTIVILGLDPEGEWVEEHRTTYDDCSVFSATFYTDGNQVVIGTGRHGAIFLSRGLDRKWIMKAALPNNNSVESATFSADGNHVAIICETKVEISSLGPDGQWTKKATTSYGMHVTKAIFSANGRCFASACEGEKKVTILSLRLDGQWTEQATITHSNAVESANFSPDGSHLVTATRDGKIKIWGIGPEGNWVEKGSYSYGGSFSSATFSADGSHLITSWSRSEHYRSLNVVLRTLKLRFAEAAHSGSSCAVI